MQNASTVITGILINSSNASHINASIDNITNTTATIGTLNNTTLNFGTMKNASTIITGQLINASNASLTNVSIATLRASTFNGAQIVNANNNFGIGTDVLTTSTAGYNTAFGTNALKINTTGYSNTAIGNSALDNNQSGFDNVAVGLSALDSNDSGDGNVAIGVWALKLSLGNNNTAIGKYADQITKNAGSENNTAIGFQAYTTTNNTSLIAVVNSTTIGANSTTNGFSRSTAIGYNASSTSANQIILGTSEETVFIPGILNTSNVSFTNVSAININASNASFRNVSIEKLISGTFNGTKIILDNNNIGVGTNILEITTGNFNTAFGRSSQQNNTTGQYNSAFGHNSLRNNTIGNSNVAIGRNTLLQNTIGSSNVAIGGSALHANMSGRFNVAIGLLSLTNNASSNSNTAIGSYADQFTNSADSNNNTAIGFQAYTASENTSSNIVLNSTAIGSYSSTNGFSNSTAIGSNASSTAANQIILGTSEETVFIPGILNISNASFTNVSAIKLNVNTINVTTINGLPYGTVSTNMSFTNLSVSGNFSMPTTAIMNVSNASFTNASITSLRVTNINGLPYGGGGTSVTNVVTTIQNISNVSNVNISNSSISVINISGNSVISQSASNTMNGIFISCGSTMAYPTDATFNSISVTNVNGLPYGTVSTNMSFTNLSATNFNASNVNTSTLYYNASTPYINISSILGVSDNERLGNSCALNAAGNILAVGSYKFNSNQGRLQIFQYQNSSWQNMSTILGGSADENLGNSCAFNAAGNILAVGSFGFNSYQGKLQIFQYQNSWQNMSTILGISADEYLGISCAFNAAGNILAVGSYGFNSNQGKLQVFQSQPANLNIDAGRLQTITIGQTAYSTTIGYPGSQFTVNTNINASSVNNANIVFDTLNSNAAVFNGAFGTGDGNTALGTYALYANTSGNNNTAVGAFALDINASGNNNTAVGMYALTNASGSNNTAIGTYSDQYTQNTNANNNTAVGYQAYITTQNTSLNAVINSTAIGANSTTGGFSYSTAIGYNSTCTAANQIQLGTSAETVVSQGTMNAVSFNSTSDLRMKDIIRTITIEEATKLINNNTAVLFKWKETKSLNSSKSINSGYIAQELITSGFSHLVSELNNPKLKEPDGPNGKQYILNYDGIIPYHGVAIKHLLEENIQMKKETSELKKETSELKKETSELKEEISGLKEEMRELRQLIKELKN